MIQAFIFFLLPMSCTQIPKQERDAKAIEIAKSTRAIQIEASLPDKAFASWLRDIAGDQNPITWEINDCGEQSGVPSMDRSRDMPMCAEAQVVLGEKRKLFVELYVGTFNAGIAADPAKFFFAVITEPDGSQNWIRCLSRIPEAIGAIK